MYRMFQHSLLESDYKIIDFTYSMKHIANERLLAHTHTHTHTHTATRLSQQPGSRERRVFRMIVRVCVIYYI